MNWFRTPESIVAREVKKSKDDVRVLTSDLRVLERDTSILREKAVRAMQGGRHAEARAMAERIVAAEKEIAAIHGQVSERQKISQGTKTSFASHRSMESIGESAKIRSHLGKRYDHSKIGGEIVNYKKAESDMRRVKSTLEDELDEEDSGDDEAGPPDEGGRDEQRICEILDALPGGAISRIQSIPTPPSGPIKKRATTY